MSGVAIEPAQVMNYLSNIQKDSNISSGFLLAPDIFSNRPVDPYPQTSQSLGWMYAAIKNPETHPSVTELATKLLCFHSSILFRLSNEAPEAKCYGELEDRIKTLLDNGLLNASDAELLKNHVSELKQLSLQIYPLDKLNIKQTASRLSEKYSCSSSKGDGPVSRYLATRKVERKRWQSGGICEIVIMKLLGKRSISPQILPESVSLTSRACRQALAARLKASILYSRLIYQGAPLPQQISEPGAALYKSTLGSTQRELIRLGHAMHTAKQTAVAPTQWDDFNYAFSVWNPLNKLKLATVHVLTAAKSNSEVFSKPEDKPSTLIGLSDQIDQKLATTASLQAGVGKCNAATVDEPIVPLSLPNEASNAGGLNFKLRNFDFVNSFVEKIPEKILEMYWKTRLDIGAKILEKSKQRSQEEMDQRSNLFHQMSNIPPQQRFVLSSQSDAWSANVARQLIQELNVPRPNQYEMLPWQGWGHDNNRPQSGDHLKNLTSESHLMLIGHGRENQFEGYSPKALVSRLYQAGLREAGVIEFKSCNIGKENYLQKLADEFKQAGIRVNHLIGFDGPLYSHGRRSRNQGIRKLANSKMLLGGERRVVPQSTYSPVMVREQNAARIVQGLA